MSEWKEIKLKEFASINMGQSPKSEYYNNEGIGLPFLQGNRTFGIRYPSIDTYCSEPKKIANSSEILFSVRAPVGDINIANQKICIGRGLASLNALNGGNIFLYYLLHYLKREILNSEGGTVFGSINRTDLGDINIILPPLPEQCAIASVLSSLDDKIDLLHRQNKTLEAMAETLFRQWFVEEAQEDWEEGVLGDVIELFDHLRIPLSKMERNKKKDGQLYPYYGAAKVMDYINDYIFDGDYILLGEDGTVRTNEGYPVLQYATGKFWVNNHTHVIKAKPPYSNFFLWNYLSKKNIDEIITGAVQPKINQGNLKALDFPKFPDSLVLKFNEQTESFFKKMNKNQIQILKFNEQTESFFKKMNKNQIQITTLKKLRDTLLPKLMSGEVRCSWRVQKDEN